MEDKVPTCQSCIYADDSDTPADGSEMFTLCRRHAPTIIIGGWGIFPKVAWDAFCGEWVSLGPAQQTFLENDMQHTPLRSGARTSS